MKHLLTAAFIVFAGLPTALHAVNISGGGTNVLSAAIDANTTNGATLVILDSATYTETENLAFGQRYSAANGRRAINLEVAPGQSPTIVLQNANFTFFSGSDDVQVGSNTGGKLNVNATAAANPAVWYIGQEDGLASGQASQVVIENVEFDFGTVGECIVFGAGSNDPTPNTTSASLTLDNVVVRGGNIQLRTLYGPANYASTVNVVDSFFYDGQGAQTWNIENGAFGLGGPDSVLNLTRTIVYNSPVGSASPEPHTLVSRLGRTNVDHSDLISIATTAGVDRAIGITGGAVTVTNSILHGSLDGVVDYGLGGSAALIDSNVTGGRGFNYAGANATATNLIAEWPYAYWSIGTDPLNLNQFAVQIPALSRTHGSTPPLGSRGSASVPVELSNITLD